MDNDDWTLLSRKGIKRDFLSCISYNDLPSFYRITARKALNHGRVYSVTMGWGIWAWNSGSYCCRGNTYFLGLLGTVNRLSVIVMDTTSMLYNNILYRIVLYITILYKIQVHHITRTHIHLLRPNE